METSSLPFWALVFLLPLILLIKKTLKSSGNKKLNLPPTPPGLPYIGNFHQLGDFPYISLCNLAKKHGPVMLMKYGNTQTVVVSSAEGAEEILKTNDLLCCTRPALTGSGKLTYNYLDVGFSPYGEYWRHIRKICVVELFSIKSVQSYRFIREEEVASLMKSLKQSATLGESVNVTAKITTLVANVTFRISFGISFESTNFAQNKLFKSLVDEAEVLFGKFAANDNFKYVGWIVDRITGFHAQSERVFREMDIFFEQIIKDHSKPDRKVIKGQEDIVDALLKIKKERVGAGTIQLTNEHIKAVLMDIFVAGVATGTDSLIWAMTELAKNPRVMKKAQEEVRNVMGTKEIVTENEVGELQYLKMVVKEALRLHPAAPLLIPRQAMEHFTVLGYDVIPGMLIQINAWSISRDPKYWKNPEEFIPERFLENSYDFKGQKFEYLPFGSGRRSCAGQHMAVTLLEILLANLLFLFDWKLPAGAEDINMDAKPGPSVTITKKEPLILVPINYRN